MVEAGVGVRGAHYARASLGGEFAGEDIFEAVEELARDGAVAGCDGDGAVFVEHRLVLVEEAVEGAEDLFDVGRGGDGGAAGVGGCVVGGRYGEEDFGDGAGEAAVLHEVVDAGDVDGDDGWWGWWRREWGVEVGLLLLSARHVETHKW